MKANTGLDCLGVQQYRLSAHWDRFFQWLPVQKKMVQSVWLATSHASIPASDHRNAIEDIPPTQGGTNSSILGQRRSTLLSHSQPSRSSTFLHLQLHPHLPSKLMPHPYLRLPTSQLGSRTCEMPCVSLVIFFISVSVSIDSIAVSWEMPQSACH